MFCSFFGGFSAQSKKSKDFFDKLKSRIVFDTAFILLFGTWFLRCEKKYRPIPKEVFCTNCRKLILA